jgi:hypothetical protein
MKKINRGIAALVTAAALVVLPATAAHADAGAAVSWPDNGGGAGSTYISWPGWVHTKLMDLAANSPYGFCYTAQLSDVGWDGNVSCVNGDTSAMNRIGQPGHRIEAIAFAPGSKVANMCMQAHVQNIGWQNGNCAWGGDYSAVGTVGRALQMEDLAVWVSGLDFHASAALTDGEGISTTTCGSSYGPDTLRIGTTGEDLGLIDLYMGAGC